MISICEKVRLQQLRIFNISLNIAHFSKKILTEPHTTSAIYCVNLMIFLYLALNRDTFFKKLNFLEKLISSFFFEQDHG